MTPPRPSSPAASWTALFYPAALVLFAVLFGAEAFGLSRASDRLSRAVNALEGRGLELSLGAAQVAEAGRRSEQSAKDLEFLQNIPNILPQDKSYVRTQKILAEDVRALRARLISRLKGELYILVDAKANKLYLKKGMKLLWQADCSVGRGGLLSDKATGRRWEFVTPLGEFRVQSKAVNPLWRKPDWAYVEEGEKNIPPPDDPSRYVAGELGAFLLNLGDGYLIHGTKDEAALGRPASHGCVRLGADDLKRLYAAAPVGTRVFIFY